MSLFVFSVSAEDNYAILDLTNYDRARYYSGSTVVTSSFSTTYSTNKVSWTGDYAKGYSSIRFLLNTSKRPVSIGGTGNQSVRVSGTAISNIVRPGGQQAGGLLYSVVLYFAMPSSSGYAAKIITDQVVSSTKNVDYTFTVPAGAYLSEIEYVMESAEGQGYYWGFGDLSLNLSFSWITSESQMIIDNQNENTDRIIENQNENTEKVGGFFDNRLNGILEGLKNLFIPSQEKFDSFFASLNEWMDEHFGFLYYPFSVLIDFLNRLLIFTPPDNPTITFPALTVGEYTLLEAHEYNLTTEALPGASQWRQWYVIGVNCIIGFWLVNLARKKLASIMGGSDE